MTASPSGGHSGASTYAGVLRESADHYSELEAVSDGDVHLTYAELLADTRAIAAALIARGIERGDRVAIWAPNSHWWIRFDAAAHYVGAIVVPINTRYRSAEARDILERTSARVVLIDDGFLGFGYLDCLDSVDDDADEPAIASLEFVVDVSAAPRASRRPDLDVLAWADFVREGHAVSGADVEARADSLDGNDLGDILFTSGTTGRPKGVTFRQRPVIDLYRDYGSLLGLRPGDRYLVSLPMFHGGGNKAGVLTSMIFGLAIVPLAVFDPIAMMTLIERERVTMMNGPPTVIYALLDDPRRAEFDLSSLRTAATGAAVVPVAMVERVQAELPFEHFITAYGMTECYGTATMCRAGDSPQTIANTNGRALPSIELRVIDRDGADVAPGTPGELLIRGPNVTPGFWNDPEQTAETIVDGWLHTGDIGTIDASGNLKITDRLKDLFIVGGFNVSPAEIEQAMARHPDVGEVAVIGVPDERLGEVARAFVIPKQGTAPAEAEVISWCRERMANYKVPRSVVFVDALPRNAQGKVTKADLRAR